MSNQYDWKYNVYKNIKYENMFEHFVKDISYESARSIAGIKNKTKKMGDTWEDFCCEYLNQILNWKVEKLQDCDDSFLAKMCMKRNDVGIDLLGLDDNGQSVAVQCKFRSNFQRLSWRDLSTFNALCERTGPWSKRVIITTSHSVRREGVSLPSDIFFGKHYFAKLTKDVWFKLGNMGEGHTLTAHVEKEDITNTTRDNCITNSNMSTDDLREKRLAFFASHLRNDF